MEATKALENALGAKWEGDAASLQTMALKIVEKQLLNRLGLMRKASQVTTGTDKVIEAAFDGKLQAIVIAEGQDRSAGALPHFSVDLADFVISGSRS